MPSGVIAGNTIWLRGGMYTGNFTSLLNGFKGNPIKVRPYDNEDAKIDGTLTIGKSDGSIDYAEFYELEIFNSDTDRGAIDLPSDPGLRLPSVTLYGPNSKLVNCYIHDGGVSIGSWSAATGDEVLYGNVVINGGWLDEDRGHGHGMYTQNTSGTRTIKHNIVGPHFGRTLAGYQNTGFNRGFRVHENAFVDEEDGVLLIGGESRQDDQQFNDNHVIGTLALGYTHEQNGSIQILRNRIVGNLVCRWWETIDIQHNIINAPGGGSGGEAIEFRQPADQTGKSHTWNNNEYHYLGESLDAFQDEDVSWYTFAEWKAATGFDASSTYDEIETIPDSVYVCPNEYKDEYSQREGVVIIWNGSAAASVNVDLSAMNLENGVTYRVRNALNMSESFTFQSDGMDSAVAFDMQASTWTVAIPTGWNEPLAADTWPAFGAFVLERTS